MCYDLMLWLELAIASFCKLNITTVLFHFCLSHLRNIYCLCKLIVWQIVTLADELLVKGRKLGLSCNSAFLVVIWFLIKEDFTGHVTWSMRFLFWFISLNVEPLAKLLCRSFKYSCVSIDYRYLWWLNISICLLWLLSLRYFYLSFCIKVLHLFSACRVSSCKGA